MSVVSGPPFATMNGFFSIFLLVILVPVVQATTEHIHVGEDLVGTECDFGIWICDRPNRILTCREDRKWRVSSICRDSRCCSVHEEFPHCNNENC